MALQHTTPQNVGAGDGIQQETMPRFRATSVRLGCEMWRRCCGVWSSNTSHPSICSAAIEAYSSVDRLGADARCEVEEGWAALSLPRAIAPQRPRFVEVDPALFKRLPFLVGPSFEAGGPPKGLALRFCRCSDEELMHAICLFWRRSRGQEKERQVQRSVTIRNISPSPLRKPNEPQSSESRYQVVGSVECTE